MKNRSASNAFRDLPAFCTEVGFCKDRCTEDGESIYPRIVRKGKIVSFSKAFLSCLMRRSVVPFEGRKSYLNTIRLFNVSYSWLNYSSSSEAVGSFSQISCKTYCLTSLPSFPHTHIQPALDSLGPSAQKHTLLT